MASFDVLLKIGLKPHRCKLPQTKQGFEAFVEWLKELGVKRIHACMEHTGGYELKLAQFLLSQGHKVSIVDPCRVLAAKRSDGRMAKTDAIDAQALCKFCKEKVPEPWNPRPDSYRELTYLVRHRENLVEQIILLTNRRSAPFSQSAFVHEQQDAAIELFKLQLEIAEQTIKEHVKANKQLAEDVSLIGSIKGAKFITAVKVLAEAGPISGYPTAQSLALAAGLTPIPNQSGRSMGKRKMPIYGNQRLRQALQMAATVAKTHNPAINLFAQRLTQRGKCKLLVTKAVQRKLAHIIWAILTYRHPYDPTKAVQGFQTDP